MNLFWRRRSNQKGCDHETEGDSRRILPGIHKCMEEKNGKVY